MNEETDKLATIIWDYMLMHEEPKKSDAIFCLCSHDLRVAERAAKLFLDGYGNYLIFSGGVGRLTEDLFAESEAKTFAKIAIKCGVPKNKIIIEDKSTNTGENILFTYSLLKELNIDVNTIVLVQKPYMERRTYATFKKKWPNHSAKITVTSPQLAFDEYVSGFITKEQVINIMVGDLQRIKEYPKLGYQIKQDIPHKVWSAYKILVKLGFDKQLIQK